MTSNFRKDAYDSLCETVSSRGMIPRDSGLLLMVSGGSDSTALAYLIKRYRDEHPDGIKAVAMFHMNHKLRGQAAEDDAQFVKNLSGHLGFPLFVCEIDIASEAARSGANVEALARHERYAAANEALHSMCFHEAVDEGNARIVTAHTADDRIENLYMRTIVGTGPGGFKGMDFSNREIIRPLLECSRENLREYIESIGGETVRDEDGALWREDATNSDTDRFRAFVRHEMVPKAKEWNQSLYSTLSRTMDLVADEDAMLDQMAREILDANSQWIDENDHLSGMILLPGFGKAKRPIQRRSVRSVLKEMLGADERVDASAIESVIDCFAGGKPIGGRVVNIQGDLAVSSNRSGVRIEPMAAYRSRRRRV